jgi:hypothetical protein
MTKSCRRAEGRCRRRAARRPGRRPRCPPRHPSRLGCGLFCAPPPSSPLRLSNDPVASARRCAVKARKRDAAPWPAEPRATHARACVAVQPPLGTASPPAAELGNDVGRPPDPRAPRRPRASPPLADGTARVPTRTTTGATPVRAADDNLRPRDEHPGVVVNPRPPLTPEEEEAIVRRLVALLLRSDVRQARQEPLRRA